MLCTIHFGFMSVSFLSVCGGLNSAIYTLLLCVYLISVLLFYYFLGLSLLYLGLEEKASSYYLVSWATFSFFLFSFFQVLNSNYSPTCTVATIAKVCFFFFNIYVSWYIYCYTDKTNFTIFSQLLTYAKV